MRLGQDKFFFAFDKNNQPALRVTTPCQLTMESGDALCGQVTSEEQRLESLDFARCNPATGPVYVEGAEPGDALRVRVSALRLADTGFTMTIPGTGLLPDQVKGKVAFCPVKGGKVLFRGLELPLRPMIGVIGVAPAGDAVPCGTPGAHGGNMDTTGIGPGCDLYFPVNVPGALFGLGDLHATMGDGEVCVTGVEITGEADLELELFKGMKLPCPLLKSGGELAFLASALTTDEAIELSVKYMHALIMKESGWDLDDVLMLMSLCGQARISQLVDPLKTARFCMPLAVLRELGVDRKLCEESRGGLAGVPSAFTHLGTK